MRYSVSQIRLYHLKNNFNSALCQPVLAGIFVTKRITTQMFFDIIVNEIKRLENYSD